MKQNPVANYYPQQIIVLNKRPFAHVHVSVETVVQIMNCFWNLVIIQQILLQALSV